MTRLRLFHMTVALNFFLGFAYGQKRKQILLGTYEYHIDARHEWWRIKLNSDSTFVHENRSTWQLDSSQVDSSQRNIGIGYVYGRWKTKGKYIYFYQCKNSGNVPELENSRWKYRKRRIYSGNIYSRFHLDLIK